MLYNAYKEALIRHLVYMAPKAEGYTVDSVYFGGGTPSLLPADVLSELAQAVRSCFLMSSDCEMTLEMNPGTSDYNAMQVYLKNGFNRLSIGCQSANDDELKQLGRIHSFADYCQTVSMARKAGFANISADLMMGLPNQDWTQLSHSIDEISQTAPDHISVYGLKIEEDTWFGRHREELSLPDEDTDRMLYLNMVEKLSMLGYNQYEISNFARTGYESRHNLKYWRAMPYLGFGPAAYSCFENCRYGYKRDLNGYLKATQTFNFDAFKQDEEILSEADIKEEKLILGLRLKEGIELSEYSFDSGFAEYVKTLCDSGHAELTNGRLCLSPKGMLVDNYITSELLLHLD